MSRYNFQGEVIDDSQQFSDALNHELASKGIRSAWFWELQDALDAMVEVGLEPSEDAAETLFYFHRLEIENAMREAGKEVILRLLRSAKEKGVID